MFDLGIKNCKIAPETFCFANKRWEIDGAALKKYFDLVIHAAKEKCVYPVLTDPASDARLSKANSAEQHGLISGKYVATMMFHYIKFKYSLGSITFDSFIFRLAKNNQLSSLEPLRDRILNAMEKSHKTPDIQA